MIRSFAKDLRLAARSLARAPRFTAVAVFTLALGIGAVTAIFSVVNGILLRPLDYPEPDELVNVWSTAPGLGYDQFPLSPDLYFFYRQESSAFREMALYQGTVANLTEEGEPERIAGMQGSRTLAAVLAVEPLVGRVFSAEEDLPEGAPVVVLSEGLWRRRFAADPSVVGRTVVLDGVTREVVGVMPQDFDRALVAQVEFWIPLGMDPDDPLAGNFAWNAVARLAPGMSAEAANAQLVPLVDRFREVVAANPDGGETYAAFITSGRFAPVVNDMKEDMVGSLREPLLILLGTVGFVLLIACANVANLVLIRAEGRRRETALRVAVGGSRASVARHYLGESVVLAGVGAALGLLVAWVGVPLVLSQAPPQLPRVGEVGVDGTVLLFTLAAAVLATGLFGAFPVLRYTRPEVLGALKQGGRGSTGPARHRGRKALVALQMALALVLLVGSGLLVRSFQRILSSDLGFETTDRLTFGVFLPESRYATPSEVTGFHERLGERLGALPGVRSVGVSSGIPMAQDPSGTAFEIEDHPTEPGQLPPMIHYVFAGPGYLEAMGIDLLQGRGLGPLDHRSGEPVIVVGRNVAERFWPNGDALGRRMRFSGDTLRWYSVVGVVDAVLQDGAREEPRPLVYLPMMGPAGDPDPAADDGNGSGSWALRQASWVVEAESPAALGAAVRAAVWEIDPDLPVADLRTVEEIVAEDVVRLSFTMFTLGIAALLALVLGAVGLYGVLSYSVAQRTQEIGVRMALGARAGEVLAMVVRDGARTQALGLVLGLLGAAALTRLLGGMLYGVEPLDPLTFGVTAAMLFGVGMLAAYLPARRAANLDPVESMRNE